MRAKSNSLQAAILVLKKTATKGKTKKSLLENIENISSSLVLLNSSSPSAQAFDKLSSLLRAPFLPLYENYIDASLNLSACILEKIYNNGLRPFLERRIKLRNNQEGWEAVAYSLLSGVLDFLENNGSESTRTAVGNSLYPPICKLFFIRDCKSQLNIDPTLLYTTPVDTTPFHAYMLLSESAIQHSVNQSKLRTQKLLGGHTLGLTIAMMRDYVVLEALLNLLAHLLPPSSTSKAKRTAFLHEVFFDGSPISSSCRNIIIDILQCSSNRNWEETTVKIFDSLSSSDISFPQPFDVKEVIVCGEKYPQPETSDRLYLDKIAIFINVRLEDDMYESLQVFYETVNKVHIAGTNGATVTVSLNAPPKLANQPLITSKHNTSTLLADIAIADVPRFIEVLRQRNLTCTVEQPKRLQVLCERVSVTESSACLDIDADGKKCIESSRGREVDPYIEDISNPMANVLETRDRDSVEICSGYARISSSEQVATLDGSGSAHNGQKLSADESLCKNSMRSGNRSEDEMPTKKIRLDEQKPHKNAPSIITKEGSTYSKGRHQYNTKRKRLMAISNTATATDHCHITDENMTAASQKLSKSEMTSASIPMSKCEGHPMGVTVVEKDNSHSQLNPQDIKNKTKTLIQKCTKDNDRIALRTSERKIITTARGLRKSYLIANDLEKKPIVVENTAEMFIDDTRTGKSHEPSPMVFSKVIGIEHYSDFRPPNESAVTNKCHNLMPDGVGYALNKTDLLIHDSPENRPTDFAHCFLTNYDDTVTLQGLCSEGELDRDVELEHFTTKARVRFPIDPLRSIVSGTVSKKPMNLTKSSKLHERKKDTMTEKGAKERPDAPQKNQFDNGPSMGEITKVLDAIQDVIVQNIASKSQVVRSDVRLARESLVQDAVAELNGMREESVGHLNNLFELETKYANASRKLMTNYTILSDANKEACTIVQQAINDQGRKSLTNVLERPAFASSLPSSFLSFLK